MLLPFRNSRVEIIREGALHPARHWGGLRRRGAVWKRHRRASFKDQNRPGPRSPQHNVTSSLETAFLFRVESAAQAQGTRVFCVINNFYDPRRHGSLPRTHTQSSSFIHQTHTSVLALTPSSGFYLKIQHSEQSNTVASEIKLLRKLPVTVNLRFTGLAAPPRHRRPWGCCQELRTDSSWCGFFSLFWLLFNKKHALWLIGFAPSGLLATSWGIKESGLAPGQINRTACWLLTARSPPGRGGPAKQSATIRHRQRQRPRPLKQRPNYCSIYTASVSERCRL